MTFQKTKEASTNPEWYDKTATTFEVLAFRHALGTALKKNKLDPIEDYHPIKWVKLGVQEWAKTSAKISQIPPEFYSTAYVFYHSLYDVTAGLGRKIDEFKAFVDDIIVDEHT